MIHQRTSSSRVVDALPEGASFARLELVPDPDDEDG